jgi:protease-4
LVAQSRHKSPQQIDAIAQGRVWDGGTAHQLGLVDGFGGMNEAIAKAAELAKLGDDRSVRYLEPPLSFRDELLQSLSDEDSDSAAPEDAFAMLSRKSQQQIAAVIGEVQSMLDGPSIQARCLECEVSAPAPLKVRDKSLLELIANWLS